MTLNNSEANANIVYLTEVNCLNILFYSPITKTTTTTTIITIVSATPQPSTITHSLVEIPIAGNKTFQHTKREGTSVCVPNVNLLRWNKFPFRYAFHVSMYMNVPPIPILWMYTLSRISIIYIRFTHPVTSRSTINFPIFHIVKRKNNNWFSIYFLFYFVRIISISLAWRWLLSRCSSYSCSCCCYPDAWFLSMVFFWNNNNNIYIKAPIIWSEIVKYCIQLYLCFYLIFLERQVESLEQIVKHIKTFFSFLLSDSSLLIPIWFSIFTWTLKSVRNNTKDWMLELKRNRLNIVIFFVYINHSLVCRL